MAGLLWTGADGTVCAEGPSIDDFAEVHVSQVNRTIFREDVTFDRYPRRCFALLFACEAVGKKRMRLFVLQNARSIWKLSAVWLERVIAGAEACRD